MKIRSTFLGLLGLIFSWLPIGATPSTQNWTVATTDVQPFGVVHIGVDNYFTLFRKSADGGGAFPTDVGLTVGILPFQKLQLEMGLDVVEPSDDPLFFNAKLGVPEEAFFRYSPALSLGIFNAGTRAGVSDQNSIDVIVGKTIPVLGRLFAGYYIGNKDVLGEDNGGFLFGFDRSILADKSGGYNKVVLSLDYCDGDNALGGGAAGLYYYFNKDISLLMGPVWFNNEAINGDWKWTVQIDINVKAL